ncbi:cell envelope integrity protein CreD [Chondrinema litorale]|uniref:cell envelope integrity protein CreD n=1 Tax=Chondrinema litorale TaxID=2994555 RepID=UPI002543FCB3|nr:cell envelope integrity protein CreD [Chondrinema litorale]UZR93897.1 cell envelope integrity protein CreD [Chondrinema litorale]
MNDSPSFFERLNNWIRNSVMVKLISMAILILLLLIPANMVESLIREREYRRLDVINEISGTWGNDQTLTSAVLTVPYEIYFTNDKKEVVTQTQYAHFLPENLQIDGEISPEKRYRSLYEVVVYVASLSVKGNFKNIDFSEWNIRSEDILWNKAFLSIGITDMRGIQEKILLQWNDTTLSLNPGIESNDVIESGVSVKVPVNAESANLNFSYSLTLNGSKTLNFIPLGEETNVSIISSWSDPSFMGAFIPDEKTINNSGFTADWKVLHLNRNYPQKWRGESFHVNTSSFGVNLLVPVDHYQKSTRSAKYAVMFIALTFLIFFFVEILNQKRIHPIQYILVGLALCIFYTVLVALSEHISFNLAYIASAIAVIVLISLYASSFFKSTKLTLLCALVLVILYGFLFTLLQLQDYALLLGSFGLFVTLAIVMYLSRNINWYDFINKSDKE